MQQNNQQHQQQQQTTVIYEQEFGLDGELPADYHDVSQFYSDRYYRIRPGEEILVLIGSAGFRFSDDVIWPLQRRGDSGRFYDGGAPLNTLCYLIRNVSDQFTVHVGYKSSLRWLLDMPRVKATFCYAPSGELAQLKIAAKTTNREHNSIPSNMLIANDGTIAIH